MRWPLFDLIAALSLLGVLDALTTKVVLTDASISIRKNLRRRTYLRNADSKASWEGGAQVSILVEPDGWIRLPDVGSPRSLVNGLDHWIKRQPVA
jgi:hypothetical protein